MPAPVTTSHTPMHRNNLLVAGILTLGLTCSITGISAISALAAAALPAQILQSPAPTSNLQMANLQMESSAEASAQSQPLPPMPVATYDARLHDGLVALDMNSGFAGIDHFITGPVLK